VIQVATGNWHTCALIVGGRVRCWGRGDTGALGYGNLDTIGDDETPASVGDVEVGGTTVALIGGKPTMCALLDTGTLRCWGSGEAGRLGYGNVDVIGDDETPASVGDVPLGDLVVAATASSGTCALLYSGGVKCWGSNYNYTLGQPGWPFDIDIGDDETPDTLAPIQILDQ
jgi:alpha-tubulin suppressor-like RCC1 family protein